MEEEEEERAHENESASQEEEWAAFVANKNEFAHVVYDDGLSSTTMIM